MRPGILFIVVGPPGVGKNALINDALQRFSSLKQLATVTTRPRRAGEEDGRERLFVTPAVFQKMIAKDELLEWQEVHRDRFYGVPRATLEAALSSGQHLIADIDVLGATFIRSLYPDNVILTFVEPPSVETLGDRMHERGDDEDDIHTRLSRVAMEMAYRPVADYALVNDDLQEATQQFQSIITAELKQPTERRFDHSVTVLPIYDHEVLSRDQSPHYPGGILLPQEIPHLAAVRQLSMAFDYAATSNHLLRIKPNQGSFISPAKVEVQQWGNLKTIRFTYLYLLPERILAGSEWSWQSTDQLELPVAVWQALTQQALVNG